MSQGLAVCLVLTAVVIALGALTLDPSKSDLARQAVLLLISGSLSLAAGIFLTRSRRLRLVHSVRAKLLFVLVITAVLALVNVGFTAYLMFLSGHDLTLLSLLLAFSLGMATFFAIRVSDAFQATLWTLLQGVRSMGAGRLDTRITIESGDELEALAGSVNLMAAQLETAFTRQRLLEQARRDLIAAVSHDLRSPLAAIRAMVESIIDGVVTDEETVRRYLGTVQSEIVYLSRLIDDLFELSQIDSGLLELRREPASIADLVSDTLEALGAQARRRRLTLKGEFDESIPAVLIDTARMQRVLYNLVHNAVRHTPVDGSVTIRVVDAGPEVEVSVIDTGEGIDVEELPKIFDRFYRGSNDARSREDGGSGLGLSIARSIVELHGGRIWANSTLGRGAAFTFVLPKTA